jgi:hypothetical protein
MVLFAKEYLPTSVLCFLVLIFQLWPLWSSLLRLHDCTSLIYPLSLSRLTLASQRHIHCSVRESEESLRGVDGIQGCDLGWRGRQRPCVCVCWGGRAGLVSGFHFISETGASSDSSHHGPAICCTPHKRLWPNWYSSRCIFAEPITVLKQNIRQYLYSIAEIQLIHINRTAWHARHDWKPSGAWRASVITHAW